MITRNKGTLAVRTEPAAEAALQLEADGYVLLPGVLTGQALADLRADVTAVFDGSDPDRAHDSSNEWRHGMLNRSAMAQAAIAAPAILEVIEPLLGEDCHVIANTAWRNAPGHGGGPWHTDAGPHVPRPAGVTWPDAIPYPVFAIGMHLFLDPCPIDAGPTAVVPGSHRSGQKVPKGREQDMDLTWDGRPPVFLSADAGDVILFVSDAWHRGTPAQPGQTRFFLQAHYARRDIAQRIRTTAEVNHLSAGAAARAGSTRERQLAGLHDPYFYDA
jgi:hypothetical protein